MKNKMIAALVALAISVPIVPAFASGGGGGGGFSGGGRGAGTQSRTPTIPRIKLTPEQRAFQNGQRAFKKSVSCKKCAYPKGIKATATAKEVVAQIKSGKIKVKESRKKDLLYYMSQRYRVRS